MPVLVAGCRCYGHAGFRCLSPKSNERPKDLPGATRSLRAVLPSGELTAVDEACEPATASVSSHSAHITPYANPPRARFYNPSTRSYVELNVGGGREQIIRKRETKRKMEEDL